MLRINLTILRLGRTTHAKTPYVTSQCGRVRSRRLRCGAMSRKVLRTVNGNAWQSEARLQNAKSAYEKKANAIHRITRKIRKF